MDYALATAATVNVSMRSVVNARWPTTIVNTTVGPLCACKAAVTSVLFVAACVQSIRSKHHCKLRERESPIFPAKDPDYQVDKSPCQSSLTTIWQDITINMTAICSHSYSGFRSPTSRTAQHFGQHENTTQFAMIEHEDQWVSARSYTRRRQFYTISSKAVPPQPGAKGVSCTP